jgi:amino acid adenylation domain-containing protein
VRLRGELDVKALGRALSEVVARHEVLRTTLHEQGGVAWQEIGPPLEMALPVFDISGDQDPLGTAKRLATEEARIPFELSAGPLLRARLLRMASDDHVLCVTMHHVVADAWSRSVLVRELGMLYGALVEGKEPALPALPVQYADFSVWQRRWLGDGELVKQLEYWRERLTGAPPILELPADRPRPVVNSYRGASWLFDVSGETGRGLRALGQEHGTTLFMVLLSAFQAVLGRFAATRDVVVGVPMGGRVRPELEPLIGFFVNTLVMRTDCTGDPRFVELLARVRETALGAYAHQDLPFEQLVEELSPTREAGRNPLVQVMFQLNNAPQPSLDLHGLRLEPFAAIDEVTRFDLSMYLLETGDGLSGQVVYSSDLFDEKTAVRLAEAFQQVLSAVAANPALRCSELPILGKLERQRLLTEWSHIPSEEPVSLTVPELLRAQVIAAPDAVAVVSPSRRLTYAQLDAAARVVAQRLRERGAGPGHVVGVCATAQVEMVTGILGVMLAGAAYLPLDPAHPADRLSFMLADSGAAVVLVGTEVTMPGAGAIPVSLDGVFESGEVDDDLWQSVASPQDLAYVIYTSGSTGRPKGVEVTHASLANLAAALDAKLNEPGQSDAFACGTQTLLTSSFAFDASIKQVLLMLAGVTLHVLDDDVRRDPTAVVRYLRDNRIDSFNCTPSMLRAMIGAGVFDQDYAPRGSLIAGEAIDQELWLLLADLAKLYGHDAVNLYGPTECTVDATIARVSGDRPVIGRPIRNASVYVLDADGALAPAGVPGELYVGGAGVARGYRGRPELTAERFVHNPFGEPGERLYRTGDLVRFTDSGDLEFLGRLDDQVKIRGYRVEPGEIEVMLRGNEAVDQAVVVAREYGPGDLRLLAYVTPTNQPWQENLGVELRDDLALVLPDYLVPAAVIVLDHMPLAPGGKLDRTALPAPDGMRPGLSAQFQPPATPVQEIIAGIWTDLLGVSPIGTTDHFFDLGGHSMLAIQVISRINAAFGIELTLRAIFDVPTITALALEVEELLTAREGAI